MWYIIVGQLWKNRLKIAGNPAATKQFHTQPTKVHQTHGPDCCLASSHHRMALVHMPTTIYSQNPLLLLVGKKKEIYSEIKKNKGNV